MGVGTPGAREVFVGRAAELDALRAALARARTGRAQTVLVTGPAGIGKTALVDRFVAAEPGVRVLRAAGEQWEALVSYGVVDQLLRVAGAGGALGAADEPVTVGVRVLDLLTTLAGECTVVVVVDDAHWADTDSLRSLLFAARRLVAEPVLVVLTVRAEEQARIPEGLRRLADGAGAVLPLATLDVADVQRLATAFGVADLPARSAARLRDHTQGNPLYTRALLAELPAQRWRTWEPVLPAPRSFAEHVRARLRACSAPAQALVEATSAVGAQAPVALVAALAEVAEPLPALDEAAAAGLLEIRAAGVAFPHPLVQAAIYEQLGLTRRVRLHLAAAGLVGDEGAALHHRVAAATPPDDALAADLDAFARRREATGGWAVAATALVEASGLSSARDQREQLLLRAVDAMIGSGDLHQASAMTDEIRGAHEVALRDAALGYLAVLRANPVEAGTALERAWARRGQVGDTRVSALVAQRLALHAVGRLDPEGIVTWTDRSLALPATDELVRIETSAIRGLGLGWSGRMADGLAAHVALVDELAGLPEEVALSGRAHMPQGWLRLVSDDVAGARTLLADAAASQLRSGSFRIAVWATAWLSRAEFLAGDWDAAARHAARAVELLEESGHEWLRPLARWAAAAVAAARGEWQAADEHVRLAAVRADDYELMTVTAALAAAQPAAARADHEGVLRAVEPVLAIGAHAGLDEPGFWPWQDLYAEALVGVGEPERAAAFLVPHEERATARGRASSIARLARVRGRVEAAAGHLDAAEAAFRHGLAALERLPLPFERALLELAYGQTLRRGRQRRAAVEHLTSAHAAFTALAARPYAQRCERELAAGGLRPAKRSTFDPSVLTAQELAVARLVAAGGTNKDVAAELFVSAKTVQTHLTRIYAKVGVRSRTELAARLHAAD